MSKQTEIKRGPSSDEAATVAVVMRTKSRLLVLPRALSSVLLQTFTGWHLYLVNDGGDQEALERLLRVYRPVFGNRLTVIHHEKNMGMEAASNTAIRAGTEEFVVIHDDDDTWDTKFLSTTVSFLTASKNSRYLGVATDCMVVEETLVDGAVRELHRYPWHREGKVADFSKTLAENPFPSISFLFRRAALNRVGDFNERMPVLGDWEFNLRLLKEGDIAYIPKPLAHYHLRRIDTKNNIYSNLASGGTNTHHLHNVLLRNQMLRETLDKNPEILGVMLALMKPLEEMRVQIVRSEQHGAGLREKIAHLEHRLNEQTERQQDIRILLGAGLDEMRHLLNIVMRDLEQPRMIASWQSKILRPVHRVWRTVLPARRVLARLRGRS